MEELEMTAAEMSALEWQLVNAERLDNDTASVRLRAQARVMLAVDALIDLNDMATLSLKVRPLACVIANEVMPPGVTRLVLEESIFYSEAWQHALKAKLAA